MRLHACLFAHAVVAHALVDCGQTPIHLALQAGQIRSVARVGIQRLGFAEQLLAERMAFGQRAGALFGVAAQMLDDVFQSFVEHPQQAIGFGFLAVQRLRLSVGEIGDLYRDAGQ